jgi:hypothetical protein
MKKIKITEGQLKKLLVNKKKLSEQSEMDSGVSSEYTEQMDMMDEPSMNIKVKMAIFSHLSDIQEMGIDEQASDRINFIKRLINKFPDTNQQISTRDLDQIYNEMLGMSDDDIEDMKKDELKPEDNPFPDGFDFSMNESIEKIKTDFRRFLF